jgi:hypothetical protein
MESTRFSLPVPPHRHKSIFLTSQSWKIRTLRIPVSVPFAHEVSEAMSSFNAKIGEFMVIARYQLEDHRFIWNAVAYQAGNPVLSVAGSVDYDPKINPAFLVEGAIAKVLEARLAKTDAKVVTHLNSHR